MNIGSISRLSNCALIHYDKHASADNRDNQQNDFEFLCRLHWNSYCVCSVLLNWSQVLHFKGKKECKYVLFTLKLEYQKLELVFFQQMLFWQISSAAQLHLLFDISQKSRKTAEYQEMDVQPWIWGAVRTIMYFFFFFTYCRKVWEVLQIWILLLTVIFRVSACLKS